MTGKQLANVAKALDGDYEQLDGLEELEEEDQEKVQTGVLQKNFSSLITNVL